MPDRSIDRPTDPSLPPSNHPIPLALPPYQSAFPDIPEEPYDLIVLGSGPGGETAGCKAAQLGAKVCIYVMYACLMHGCGVFITSQ